MTFGWLMVGLIQFSIVAVVVRKTGDGKVSRIRAVSVGLIAAVAAIAVHLLFQQIAFPEAIAHWVQTGSFR